ncbi:hypothetical protein TSMEX_011024 [Taenia solium]|eukprot:TsM_000871800 transcript=TsM_000871800 gene=TsM_000871800
MTSKIPLQLQTKCTAPGTRTSLRVQHTPDNNTGSRTSQNECARSGALDALVANLHQSLPGLDSASQHWLQPFITCPHSHPLGLLDRLPPHTLKCSNNLMFSHYTYQLHFGDIWINIGRNLSCGGEGRWSFKWIYWMNVTLIYSIFVTIVTQKVPLGLTLLLPLRSNWWPH